MSRDGQALSQAPYELNVMKAPDEDPPELITASLSRPNSYLSALESFRKTLTDSHAEILQKLDSEIRQLRDVAADIRSMSSLEDAKAFNSPGRRSVTLQDQKSVSASDERRRISTSENPGIPGQTEEDRSPATLSVVPVPAARARTDPKAFLPSLSKKQRGRNWFKQQSVAVLQDRPEDGSPQSDFVKARKSIEGEEDDNGKSVNKQYSQGVRRRSFGESNGLFGGMRSQFSIESVQMHAMDSMVAEEKADNLCAKIVSHPYFDRFMMLVVILNCIEMAISVEFDRDSDPRNALHTALIASGNAFCIMFLVEIVLRCFSYTRFFLALQDGWFLFDLALLLLMMWETWAMPFVSAMTHNEVSGAWRMARILRVLRTARMARLVRLMPELMILIKGMIVACRSVFFTLMLLLIITFIFSIAFLELSSDTPLEQLYFQSIPDAIVSLILHCIVPDQEVFFKSLADENWILGVLVLLFILLGSLTVMNMLLGVLVEAVKTVSTIEQEQMMADFARKVLWQLIQDGDNEQEADYHNRMISEKEFRSLLRKPRAMKALQKLGVDASAALDSGKMLFEDGQEVSFVDFMHAMLTLRGSNKTTVKDIVELRKYIGEEFTQIQTLVSELCTFIGDTMWTDRSRAGEIL